MNPIPFGSGMIQMTVKRNKSGFNRIWPKYTLHLSSNDRFLLTCKKRAGNKTSNYMFSLSQDNPKRDSPQYIGKLRSNFSGTEYASYDHGENPEEFQKLGDITKIRTEQAVILYEKQASGKNGPRKMKIILPIVYMGGKQEVVRPLRKEDTLLHQFSSNKLDKLVVMFNK